MINYKVIVQTTYKKLTKRFAQKRKIIIVQNIYAKVIKKVKTVVKKIKKTLK